MIEFSFKTELDPVAILALVVALISLGVAILNMLRGGYRVNISASGNYITIPDDGMGEKIRLTIKNIGGRSFKITGIGFSAGHYMRSRGLMPTHSFPIEVPFVLNAGDEESLYFHQPRLIEMAGSEFLRCNVWVAFRNKPFVTRVRFGSETK